MASGRTIKPGTLAGAGVLALVLFLSFGTLGIVIWRADSFSGLGRGEWAALRFTLWQALVSAGLSILLAIPVARALARRNFVGRGAIITLLGAPFILPTIVAILGLIAVFGRNGIISTAIGTFGFEPISIYGAHGVILAHVFFNLPLATRLILQGWMAIPGERFRLAASLGFGPREMFRFFELPMLREVIPGTFLVIFLICLTSFAVALALGGGPGSTTIELAIYQAFRLEFDLGKTALLASVQFALGAVAALITLRFSLPNAIGAGRDRAIRRFDGNTAFRRSMDAAWITLAALFLLTPLLMLVLKGVPYLAQLPDTIWRAAGRSVGMALCTAALVIAATLALAALSLRLGARRIEGVVALSLAASPLVIGTGLFILLFPFLNPSALALPITILVNTFSALPFTLRSLLPALHSIERDFGRLADGLGMNGFARLRLLWLPRLRRPIGFAAGLTGALSMGDLGVVALFAVPDRGTLPLEIYRLMGAYRMDQAAAGAVLLLVLSLGIFWILDRGGRHAET